jgi:O-antigen/teichoic acid export membrane protein
MIAESQIAVRNAGLLIAQRGSHILTGLLFAIVVPRLMGPDIYGRYGLITSITIWFALLSGMSFSQTMIRFVPQFTAQGDKDGLQKFFANLMLLRLANGALAVTAYLLLTTFLFPELDLVALVIAASTIYFRTWAKLLFALFLGLNQAARWGMGETLSRWVSLVLTIPGVYFGGLRGACLALLLTELTVLLVGLSWARPYLCWSKLRLDREYLAPYLRFSLSFYGSNILLSISQNSGEMVVRVASDDYMQVGYFGLAYRIYFIAATTIWQLTMAFGPLLTTLLTQDKPEEIRWWVERMIKWIAVGGVVAVMSVILLGEDIVPLVLGADYRPVAANLIPLTLALLTYGLGSVARLLALTYNRPGVALKAATIHLASFIGLGTLLVARRGSLAGCLAVLIASSLYAGYFTWRMRGEVTYSLWKWALPILLGGLFLPLTLLRSSWPVNLALFAVFVAGYISLLLLLKIVTPGEVERMRRALRPSALSLEP